MQRTTPVAEVRSLRTFLRVPTSFSTISFFFNDTATTEIYTLSLHDALPIFPGGVVSGGGGAAGVAAARTFDRPDRFAASSVRSEEHTSELQSHLNLVCR